jgi:hypothetical protein
MKSGVGIEQPNGRFTVPVSKTVNLVSSFQVRHADFQHDADAIRPQCGRNP